MSKTSFRLCAGLVVTAMALSLAASGALADAIGAPWFQLSSSTPDTTVSPLMLATRYVSFWCYTDGIAWAQFDQVRVAQAEVPPVYLARSATPLPSLPSGPAPAPQPAAQQPAAVPMGSGQAVAQGQVATLPDQPVSPAPAPAAAPARASTPGTATASAPAAATAPATAPATAAAPAAGTTAATATARDQASKPASTATPTAAPTPAPTAQSPVPTAPTAATPAPASQPDQPATPASQSTPASATATATTVLTSEEQEMVNLVNAERTAAGLAPLTVDLRLAQTARAKSQDMVAVGYFGHTSPTLGSPFDQMHAAGIAFKTAGENIAGNESVQAAHQALMNSPGHRANILNPEFTKIGVGAVHGSPYGIIFTQQFIGE